jgi:hypothetical protein
LGHHKSLFACIDRTLGNQFHRAGASRKKERRVQIVIQHTALEAISASLRDVTNLRDFIAAVEVGASPSPC